MSKSNINITIAFNILSVQEVVKFICTVKGGSLKNLLDQCPNHFVYLQYILFKLSKKKYSSSHKKSSINPNNFLSLPGGSDNWKDALLVENWQYSKVLPLNTWFHFSGSYNIASIYNNLALLMFLFCFYLLIQWKIPRFPAEPSNTKIHSYQQNVSLCL